MGGPDEMAVEPDDVPVVAIPERIDRKLRLGPFPSARDALKFVGYAGAAAVLDPLAGPVVALVLAGVGFLVCAYRPDGAGLDERAWAVLRHALRSPVREEGVTVGTVVGPLARRGFARAGGSRLAVVIRTGGTPLAYLPPADLARRFERYRELLRTVTGPIAVVVTNVPVTAGPMLPPRTLVERPDREALVGYAELVGLLCRRRRARRVFVAVAAEEGGADAASRLEGVSRRLVDRLADFGVGPTRIYGRSLADAARRFGWPTEGRAR